MSNMSNINKMYYHTKTFPTREAAELYRNDLLDLAAPLSGLPDCTQLAWVVSDVVECTYYGVSRFIPYYEVSYKAFN